MRSTGSGWSLKSVCIRTAGAWTAAFTSFPVASTVRYLHALWICECKDRLLSIYKNIERYEGTYCLGLLLRWQEGEMADVVDFLHRKLDMLPFSDLTRQIQDAMRTATERKPGAPSH